ncbi:MULTISPECIES: hypothetical protein [unclassified Streptomyces]|uniref:hypothetical protein n=1 Tax=unclassified Streptomyces TaxID=2593676 RepID=UPI000AD2B27D|nr:hypothetical protein [Streptomyces sp. NRRL F-2747]
MSQEVVYPVREYHHPAGMPSLSRYTARVAPGMAKPMALLSFRYLTLVPRKFR